jgi:hypothetical protein
LLTQLRESADLVFERGILRVAAVQVVQVDLLDAEAPSAHVRTLSQVVGIADGVNRRHVEATADEASLGRDDQVLGVGVQCVADQQLRPLTCRTRELPSICTTTETRKALVTMAASPPMPANIAAPAHTASAGGRCGF